MNRVVRLTNLTDNIVNILGHRIMPSDSLLLTKGEYDELNDQLDGGVDSLSGQVSVEFLDDLGADGLPDSLTRDVESGNLTVNNDNPNSKVTLGALASAPDTWGGMWVGDDTRGDTTYVVLSDGDTKAVLNAPAGGTLEIRVGNALDPGSGLLARIGDFGTGDYVFDITDAAYITANRDDRAALVVENDFDDAGNSTILDLRNSTQAMIAGVYSDGRAHFSAQSFPAATGDKVSLYDNYLNQAANYGFGVEANFLYYKSGAQGHRWYINTNADDGVSDYMELTNAGLTVNGGLALPVDSYSASPVNVQTNQYAIVCDCTSEAITVNLPAAADADATRKVFVIKKVDSSANAVTIDANGTETIDGSETYTLSNQWDTVTVLSDGTQWLIV